MHARERGEARAELELREVLGARAVDEHARDAHGGAGRAVERVAPTLSGARRVAAEGKLERARRRRADDGRVDELGDCLLYTSPSPRDS